jgi:DNA-binding NtrC family response regulator
MMQKSDTSRVLFAWIGKADLDASEDKAGAESGPIANALQAREFDRIELLSNWPASNSKSYVKWLKGKTETKIVLRVVKLSSPTDYGETYTAAMAALEDVAGECGDSADFTFHLSPGTSAMAAVWLLIAKTRYPAELIESSIDYGVKTVNFPFDLSVEFIPNLLQRSDRELVSISAGDFESPAEFSSIIYRSDEMQRVIAEAARIALRSIPVLIQGESGTGKEILAQAIHRASPRGEAPFVAVNCGAIPKELVEAEFFGVAKGGYTGAENRAGHFESADGGTLFLDEIGELPLAAQVKLLRALEEGQVTRVGGDKPRKVDVRIVAATNRDLIAEVSAGRFRVDLFYRLVVAVIQLPPLRERPGDIGLLLDHFMERINRSLASDPTWQHKELSAAARNIFLNHSWPGNIRELRNTLLRAAVSSKGERIEENDARRAIFAIPAAHQSDILNRDVSQGVDLERLLAEVAMHYLTAAHEATNGNLTKAAELVGLSSYQTFKNWQKKYRALLGLA